MVNSFLRTSSVAIPHFVGRNPTLYGLQSRTLLAVTPHISSVALRHDVQQARISRIDTVFMN